MRMICTALRIAQLVRANGEEFVLAPVGFAPR
jgi:hypothetical protein